MVMNIAKIIKNTSIFDCVIVKSAKINIKNAIFFIKVAIEYGVKLCYNVAAMVINCRVLFI